MKNGPTRQDVLWMLTGAAVFVAIFAVIWLFRQDPADAIAARSNRAELVGRMQAALYSASEAEKSAVLAITVQDFRKFADQARAATGALEGDRQELRKLLASGGTESERHLLAQFSEAFTSRQRLDDELLRFAAKDSDLQSLAKSMNQKRRATVPCLDALNELKRAILDEPIPGISYTRVPTR
jgi:hypothetical protein